MNRWKKFKASLGGEKELDLGSGTSRDSRSRSSRDSDQRSFEPSKAQIRSFKQAQRNFIAGDNSRLHEGWTTRGASIDHYLIQQLSVMQARSSEQCYNNPLARRFIRLMRRNISGSKGIIIKPKSTFNGRLDDVANDAIQLAEEDWRENHCHYNGHMTMAQIEKLNIATMVRCGEFVNILHFTGKYGVQLEVIDPELLDVTRNQIESNGDITRLGVQRTKAGKITHYWFREQDYYGNFSHGTFGNGRVYSRPARFVMHCFDHEYPSQSRGIPAMYSAIVRLKMLDGFDEAALVAARAGASKMGFIKEDLSKERETDYEGSQIQDFDAGSIERIDHEDDFIEFDPKYPHEFYAPFTKKHQRDIAMGFDVSYASMTGDLSDTNYSSIRWGGLDERDAFEEYQELFIACFRRPLYKEFIKNAILRSQIKTNRGLPLSRPVTEYYTALIRGRRWPWVDPAKEMAAAEKAVQMKVKSRAQIIRDRGDDPEETWSEIEDENARLGDLLTSQTPQEQNNEQEDEEDEDE